jgi:hypothetical protein
VGWFAASQSAKHGLDASRNGPLPLQRRAVQEAENVAGRRAVRLQQGQIQRHRQPRGGQCDKKKSTHHELLSSLCVFFLVTQSEMVVFVCLLIGERAERPGGLLPRRHDGAQRQGLPGSEGRHKFPFNAPRAMFFNASPLPSFQTAAVQTVMGVESDF